MRLNIFGFGNAAKDAGSAQAGAAASGEFAALGAEPTADSKGGAATTAGKGKSKSTGARSGSVKSGKSRSAGRYQAPPALDESLKKRVKWLLTQLEAHRERIEQAQQRRDKAAFLAAMQGYLAFIAAYEDSVAYDAFEIGPAFPEYHEFFKTATLFFAWCMEEQACEEVVDAIPQPGEKLRNLVADCVRGAYTRMDELPYLVDFSEFRSIVVLGCGKFPSSLFYLHDETTVPAIVGVDKDHDAAELSNALVKRFDLERVRILEADAATLNYAYFDAIYFGPFAAPRKDVLKRIRATARPSATIILRDPILTGSLGLEKVLPYMEPAFTLLRSGDPVKNRGRFMLRHYILKPR